MPRVHLPRTALAAVGLALLVSGYGAARPSPTAPPIRVAIVATPHTIDPTTSEVRWVVLDSAMSSSARVDRAVSIPHAPGAVVRGALVPGTDVVVVAADDDGASDPDFGATLYAADASGLRQLATGLVHASLPLPSADGFVYVERGTRGTPPSVEDARAGALRTDALTIDAVDLKTGATHPLYSWSGYALHLAGDERGGLVVYRVSKGGAALLTVDRATGSDHVVTSLPPFARDFSVRDGAVVLSNRDDALANTWVVERVDLATGARTRLHSELGESPAPFVLPGGDVVWTAPRRGGLAHGSATIAPLGLGFDAVNAATDDGAFIALVHIPNAGYDDAAVVHFATSRVARLSTKTGSAGTGGAGEGERVEPIGFVGARSGVLR